MDQVVAHRLPGTSTTRWNFHSRAVNTVYEHKENILRCFQTIRDSGDFDPITLREARGFVRMMEDEIMPDVDMLFSQLQKRNIDSVYITELIEKFTSSIQTIRDSISSGEYSGSVLQPPTKKRRPLGHEEQQLLAREAIYSQRFLDYRAQFQWLLVYEVNTKPQGCVPTPNCT
ncbi:hypothetical protein F7725_002831 [Dissostichus mawsoni]|uniref:Uncharacterized protein n=1 Tax=Dissostichus mawsoni TaxID=36200 RepID=A0A7J5Y9B6_DISMA|nr:hypothetical protein F7725_002831 [Dissostichus mawsoni]